MKAIYKALCPNCGGDITVERLTKASLCKNCSAKLLTLSKLSKLSNAELKKIKLDNIKPFVTASRFLFELNNMFKKIFGRGLFALQKTWAKRLFLGKSFSIVSPTGVGKTTFGLIASLLYAKYKKKCYIIVPTSILVQHLTLKIEDFAKKLKLNARIVAYHTSLTKKQKQEAIEKIKNNDYDIVITTDKFLSRHYELFDKFDFIFVDDVDSFLKSSRNIDKVFSVLGIKHTFDVALKLISKQEVSEDELKKFNAELSSCGQLIVSSATIKARRTKRIRLFKLLGFELGFRLRFLRNIYDVYIDCSDYDKTKMFEKLKLLIKKLGKGGLIFVPMVKHTEFVNELINWLCKNNIKAAKYESGKSKQILNEFRQGNIDVLVGIASYKSPIARGIDLPETIRYAIFVGVPRQEVSLQLDSFNPVHLSILINSFIELLDEKERINLMAIKSKLNKIGVLTKEQIERIQQGEVDEFLKFARDVMLKAQELLKQYLDKFISRIEQSNISLKKDETGFKLIIADPVAYLQASGRTSRLFVGGISKGLSIVLVDDKKSFENLKSRLAWYSDEINFVEFSSINLDEIIKQIDDDRNAIKNAAKGIIAKQLEDFFKFILLIVESPTKARTIARFFGKPSRRVINNVTVYEVTTGNAIFNIVACVGHVVDLAENIGFDGVLIDKNNFVPVYSPIVKCLSCNEQFTEAIASQHSCEKANLVSKRTIIDALRQLAFECNSVIIATDPDAEGEKIAFDLFNLLRFFNDSIARAEMHEITKKAVIKAINNLRQIDLDLVDAQVVRRIADRWVGFELSKILWRKFNNKNLSAGRVQTPVLGWIIERTSESRKKVLCFAVTFDSFKFIFKDIPKANYQQCKIEVKTTRTKINPQPPFTTDVLLKYASSLGFSAAYTMKLAQELFESGLITYHRTDSMHVSSFGISIARQWFETSNLLDIFVARQYGKEGTHECIRPTKPYDAEQIKRFVMLKIWRFPVKLSRDHFKLYDAIFRRFMASQAKPIEVEKQVANISLLKPNSNEAVQTIESEFIINILQHGFDKIMPVKIYKPLNAGIINVVGKWFKLPKAKPFTQGEVIALMKEREIGRPSTYAKIIETIIKRKYVVQQKNFMFSTKLGFIVWNYLNKFYHAYVSEAFTRKLEQDMDNIERGKAKAHTILLNLYNDIKKIVGR